MSDHTREMFNRIAPSYDLLNHGMSFGLDHIWRETAIRDLRPIQGGAILDTAAGTGDMAVRLNRRFPETNVFLTDISEEMLKIARERLGNQASIQLAEAGNQPFDSSSFKIITVAFGIRNFSDPDAFLKEAMRLLVPGGELLILEFGSLSRFGIEGILRKILNRMVPLIGGVISGDATSYHYLMESMDRFNEEYDLSAAAMDFGFKKIRHRKHFFGLVNQFHFLKC